MLLTENATIFSQIWNYLFGNDSALALTHFTFSIFLFLHFSSYFPC